MSGSKKQRFSRPHNSWNTNYILIIFGAILIYLIASIILYVLKDPVTAYEVRTGTLSKSYSFSALALREETVVTAGESGKVSYFQPDDSKVRKGSIICVTDLDGSHSDVLDSSGTEEIDMLTTEDYLGLIDSISSFQEGFSADAFDSVYGFKQQLNSMIMDLQNTDGGDSLNTIVTENQEYFNIETAPVDGIVAYHTDGYEKVTPDNLTIGDIEREKYDNRDLRKNTDKEAGDEVFKVITSENWELAFILDDDTFDYLKSNEITEIQVQFHKDDIKLWGNLELREIDKKQVAVISFSEGMVRYINDRFLNVSLILQNETGLKIPQTAVVEKEFYLVPYEYLLNPPESSSNGIIILDPNKTGGSTYQSVEVYQYDSNNGVVYLDPLEVPADAVLAKPESTDKFKISEMGSLKGVYNINKGYAVFKQIHVLAENSEYCIVDEGMAYGIANYDYIALNGRSINENDKIN